MNADGKENAATNKWGSERGSETPNPQAIHSCLPILVNMHPSCSTLMGLWCNLCPLRLPLHHIIHNCLSTAGMPPPVRNQITDGPLTTLFHSAPSLLHLQSPSPTHLHLISDLSLTYLWPLSICPFPPLVSLSCPCLPVSLISIPKLPCSSHLLNIVPTLFLVLPCFTLVPLFPVPDWVKLNLQCRVS